MMATLLLSDIPLSVIFFLSEPTNSRLLCSRPNSSLILLRHWRKAFVNELLQPPPLLLPDRLDTATVIHTSPMTSNASAETDRYSIRDIVNLLLAKDGKGCDKSVSTPQIAESHFSYFSFVFPSHSLI